MQVFHPLHSMLYTEDLELCNCVGFLQIQSHILVTYYFWQSINITVYWSYTLWQNIQYTHMMQLLRCHAWPTAPLSFPSTGFSSWGSEPLTKYPLCTLYMRNLLRMLNKRRLAVAELQHSSYSHWAGINDRIIDYNFPGNYHTVYVRTFSQ